jgi:hypothetical protein
MANFNISQRQAGHLTLNSILLKSYDGKKEIDIKGLIHTFNIKESMSLGSVRGTAIVYDAIGLLSGFPILGQEYLTITYTDFFDKTRTEYMFVYAVDDVRPADPNKPGILRYNMHFVSVGKFYSDDFRVQKTYKSSSADGALISDYVQQVFDEYYVKPLSEKNIKSKSIVVEKTDGQETYIIPRYTPEQTMMFFSRKAYKNSSKTQSFRFFESREKYHFVTNDYLLNISSNNVVGYNSNQVDPILAAATNVKPRIILTMNFGTNVTPDRQEQIMNELISIDYTERVNSITDISEGAYKRKTYEIDIINGTINSTQYDYVSDFQESRAKPVHDSTFVNERLLKEKEIFVVKDYAAIGAPTGVGIKDNTFYPEIFNRKPITFYHYNKNKVKISLHGRNDLFVGNTIQLNINNFKSTTGTIEPDVEHSGIYYVEEIDNIFYENKYVQNVLISKDGLGI